MSYNDVQDKLKQIQIEDYIWIIYVGIIILSWYSNSLEKKYFLYNDLVSKEKYRKIIIFIFSILFIIYLYFFKSSVDDIKNIRTYDSNNKKGLIYLSSLASFLIVVSGAIFLYISLLDDDINVELAFS